MIVVVVEHMSFKPCIYFSLVVMRTCMDGPSSLALVAPLKWRNSNPVRRRFCGLLFPQTLLQAPVCFPSKTVRRRWYRRWFYQQWERGQSIIAQWVRTNLSNTRVSCQWMYTALLMEQSALYIEERISSHMLIRKSTCSAEWDCIPRGCARCEVCELAARVA